MIPDKCPNCGSEKRSAELATWQAPTAERAKAVIVVGCDECSETLATFDDLAAYLVAVAESTYYEVQWSDDEGASWRAYSRSAKDPALVTWRELNDVGVPARVIHVAFLAKEVTE